MKQMLLEPHGLSLADGELGVHRLGESFLSMDTDGRVVRLDSFAKMLAPGLRVGWLTAHPELTARFSYAMHGSCLGPNTFMQVTCRPAGHAARC